MTDRYTNALQNRIDALTAEVNEQARLNGMGSEREARLMAQVAEITAENAALKSLLSELTAMVNGECPSLLDEDSGGCARLAMAIDDALGTP